MTTITLPRATVEHALEALEAMQSYAAAERKGLRICDEAIPALRTALSQQAEPDHETRAELAEQQAKPQGCDHCNHPLYAATKCRVCGRVTEWAEPVQEPVALIHIWRKNGRPHAELLDWGVGVAALPDGKHTLYTAPPQRKPLMQEQLYALYDEHATHQEEGPAMSGWFDFARAVERAHGIEEKK